MAFFNEMGTRVKLRMTAHKIRLNPTPEQEQYLRQACGVARHAFNWLDFSVIGGIIRRGSNENN